MRQTTEYLNFITSLENKKICRVLPDILEPDYLDFFSNDYLQLSKSKQILKSGIKHAKQYGLGSTGSRLLSGNSSLFEEFEHNISKSKHTQKALIFNSGFQANISVLSALLDSKILKNTPLVFFDKLNHKSLYEAVKLSGAKLIRYAHNDMNHLGYLLNKYQHTNNPKFIVAETVYGMDGDVLDYEPLIILAKQHNVLVYLDEAHATGMLGINGYGLSTLIDFQGVEHVIMGTFSKALGGSGAYIACSNVVYQYLINHCAGFIYSTACSPMVIGAMMKAWDLLPSLQPKVNKVLKLASYFRNSLKSIGINYGSSSTHIIPMICQDTDQALKLKNKLAENKMMTSFVQYPTVPKNQPRIRIALNVSHDLKDLNRLLECL